jgi:hypothetical protein
MAGMGRKPGGKILVGSPEKRFQKQYFHLQPCSCQRFRLGLSNGFHSTSQYECRQKIIAIPGRSIIDCIVAMA